MTKPVSRALVDAFYEAYAARDLDRVAEFLADDVKWTISGPVDLLTFCGTRQGKSAVLDMMQRVVPQVFSIFSFVADALLIDGDRVATLNRLSARLNGDNRVITYRLAHFMRFRSDKVVENLSLIDSFDAVEQLLGHHIGFDDVAAPDERGLIAV
ncbi:MAG TPA: nuclear transport factor 2 family protein [Pseudolabrys sp.]|nr:nuclear transport factor 2 family protein [Pseudolabrys sp.]